MAKPSIDQEGFFKFTGKARLSKAINTLSGILTGMDIDRVFNGKEIHALRGWIEDHEDLARRHPFNEIFPRLSEALSDGVLDREEIEDLKWLCGKLAPEAHYYNGITAQMQELQGVLGGIVADGVVTDTEIRELREWVHNSEHLKTCWPYDEIDSLLTQVLKDGIIDADERQMLMHFLSEFTSVTGNRAIALPLEDVDKPIQGICATCPEIAFPDRLFCFTGTSTRLARDSLATLVRGLGGDFHPTIKAEVDYLVIGARGNPCWAYSCYGRKVEQAIKLRRQGCSLLIVHENDFWDAAQDAGATIRMPDGSSPRQ